MNSWTFHSFIEKFREWCVGFIALGVIVCCIFVGYAMFNVLVIDIVKKECTNCQWSKE